MKAKMQWIGVCAASVMVLPLCAQATPLDDAAKSGDVAKVQDLLAKGADVNERDRAKRTALWWAVDADRPDVVRVLLDKGADANAADFSGMSPVSNAAFKGDGQVVSHLIAHHADVNAADSQGVRPLDNAVRLGFKDVVDMLRKAGAKCGDDPVYSKACKAAQ